MDLGSKLSFFVSSGDEFDNPFDLGPEEQKPKKELPSRSSSYGDLDDSDFDDPSTSSRDVTAFARRLDDYSLDRKAVEFDEYISGMEFADEEDSELRNTLISMGRKYARETAVSAETSEITRTFSGSENQLKKLYEEIGQDKSEIGQDITMMRSNRAGKPYKSISDMISAKAQYHNMQLGVIKELNSIRKTQYELKNKEAQRQKMEDLGSGEIGGSAIRNLFGLGRGDLVASSGGYATVSGSQNTRPSMSQSDDSEEIRRQYYDTEDDDYGEESDGDKFLRYEGRGVEYVLLAREDGSIQGVIAEDSDGVVIDDYPMPNNIEDLHFEIDRTIGEATDDLHRQYKLRIV